MALPSYALGAPVPASTQPWSGQGPAMRPTAAWEGYTAPRPRVARAPDTSLGAGALAGFGGGLQLIGRGADFIGQRQGAKSMLEEMDRQYAEQAAFERKMDAQVDADLAAQAASPIGTQMVAGAQQHMQRGLGVVQPAAQAGAKALGLGSAAASRAVRPGLPTMALGAFQAGGEDRLQRRGVADTELALRMERLRQQQEAAAGTYAARNDLASQRGAGWRTLGTGLQGLGSLTGMAAGFA